MTPMRPSVVLGLTGAFAATAATATVYELPPDQPVVFGSVERIQASYEDTLVDIARRYSLGYEEINRANPALDPWLPGVGSEIVVPGRRILPPGPREGIVINLPEHRLYYFPPPLKGEKPVVYTYPVSIGKMDWRTPIGETKIVGKQRNPSWHPPESVRKEHAERGEPLPAVVKSGPDNPLGEYAMRLGIPDGAYLIHGTNNPLAVGMAVTHGCIRMYPEDIAALFPLVPNGTKVFLINEPVKVAYVEGELLLEAHPPVDAQGQSYEPDVDAFAQRLDTVLGETTAAIHWDLALETLRTARGIPAVIGVEAVPEPAAEPLAASEPPAPTAQHQR
jgi:L,D-transpeptidase ErfK/SrfK